MAYDYRKAFALIDNPFNPYAPLAGLKRAVLQNELSKKPLLFNLEPALKPLYAAGAGPFGAHLETFQDFVRDRGYNDNPPQLGNGSFIFSIYGVEGTGKTTLSQAIVQWLQCCRTPGAGWRVYDEWSVRAITPLTEQPTRIGDLEHSIAVETAENSYCCIVADNLDSTSLSRVLAMYDQLSLDRIVFLFLISNNSQLFAELSEHGKRPNKSFRMGTLTANAAVSFVKHRVGQFRDPNAMMPWLTNNPLFPFDESDIRNSFDEGFIYEHGSRDTISLRQFSVILSQLLAGTLKSTDSSFDIAQAPQTAILEKTIQLMPSYAGLAGVHG